METWALSSTADDDGKFQPICKYLLDQSPVNWIDSIEVEVTESFLSRIDITKQTLEIPK